MHNKIPARCAGIALATGLLLALPEPTTAQVGASLPDADWPTYNGPLNGDRFSPLAQINTSNVAQLRKVCAFETQDSVSFQSGIVAVNGVLYFTAFNNTYAIDGTTCQLKWKHTYDEPHNALMVNRGVAYDNGRVFRGTGNGHVLAFAAVDGRLLWDVVIADPSKGESVPMAPVAANGLVFVGNAGGDNFGVRGRVYALDASNGKVVWEFQVVPDSGPLRETWVKASEDNPPTGGAVWTTFALDSAKQILYVTSGNPAPDFVEALHPGDNLYSNSILAIDGKSGQLLAYEQPIKGDFHDWDVSAGPALIMLPDGTPFLLAAAKDGIVYGIDRSTVDRSYDAVNPDILDIRYRAVVTTRENVTAPLSADSLVRFCPGTQGGVEWNGPAYDRTTGTLFVNAIDWCASVKLQPLDSLHGKPGEPWSGMDDPKAPFGKLDPVSKWKGWITAVDARTGNVIWKKQTPKPMVAAITSTAGGLVFTGDLDGNVFALDAVTGNELWRAATGKAIGGGVISYAKDGRQYIAVAAGLNSPIWPVVGGPASVIVYSLQ